MEILVKHPKAPGNKSEFLKALRNEKKDLEESDADFTDRSNCTNKEDVRFWNFFFFLISIFFVQYVTGIFKSDIKMSLHTQNNEVAWKVL